MLFEDASVSGFFPQIVPLTLFGFHFRVRQEHGLAIGKSYQPQWQVSHAETVFIVDAPQGKRGRINRTRTLLEMLFVDPYVNDLRVQLQHLGDAERIAVNDGVVRAFKKLRRGVACGNRISHEDQWTREGLLSIMPQQAVEKEKAAENFFPQRLRV
jgi:hypothetical protein